MYAGTFMSSDRTQDILDRLQGLTRPSTRNKKFVFAKDVDENTWFRVPIISGFTVESGSFDTGPSASYIALIQWANKNCRGRYSRTLQAFWFEDPKDAFVFRLTWGESSNEA
jgi:hypothetical protein